MATYFVFLVILFFGICTAVEFRSLDGSNNNIANPTWGSAGSAQLRYTGENFYADGISQPTAPLPEPRLISNIVFNWTVQLQNDRQLSDYATFWGQFLAHDITHCPSSRTPEEFDPIAIPTCDAIFDPNCEGDKQIPFWRSLYIEDQLPREQVNMVSSFLDGSTVYGSDKARSDALRSFVGGQLKTSEDDNSLPPRNRDLWPVQNEAGNEEDENLFFLGDVRGNENPGLLMIHVLLLREHNRLANVIQQENPDWTDEQIFQKARQFIIAFIQQITMEEYLPVTLGHPIPEYTGYDPTVNPSVFTEFSSGAFRYGHSEVNAYYISADPSGNFIPRQQIHLRDSYFNPNLVVTAGIDSFLRGMAIQLQRRVDTRFVDDLRNFLFGPPGAGGMDLVSINIQRARDHGIPSFSQTREMFGLPPLTDFTQVTSDKDISDALEVAYEGKLEDCDLYVCGLAEDHVGFANVGPTIAAVLEEQYIRLRDGDRFWWENLEWTEEEKQEIQATTLGKIILRNTDTEKIQCYVMALPDSCVLGNGTTGGGGPTDDYEFFVEVVPKSPELPFFGVGADVIFSVNGEPGAALNLTRGKTYRFKNTGGAAHQLFISRSPTGVDLGLSICGSPSIVGCPSQAGSILSFTPPLSDDEFSDILLEPNTVSYACAQHQGMGGKINLIDGDFVTNEETNSQTENSDHSTSKETGTETVTETKPENPTPTGESPKESNALPSGPAWNISLLIVIFFLVHS